MEDYSFLDAIIYALAFTGVVLAPIMLFTAETSQELQQSAIFICSLALVTIILEVFS